MRKRITAWLLCVVMVLSMFSGIAVDAQSAVGEVNLYKYTNKDSSMPQTGTAKTVFFLVQFPDHQNTDDSLTAKSVQSAYFSAKSEGSITTFYHASSMENLNIKGTVYGWYTAAKKRSKYNGASGNRALYQEVVSYYDAQGVDFSKFDGDGDGVVDCVYLLFAGEDTGYGSDWWSCSGYLGGDDYCVDGKQLGSYVKLAENDLAAAIHETGHTLGLWDYYRMDENGAASYGIGGYDIMDDNLGDHNALSKIMLGWITPSVICSEELKLSDVISLENSQNGGCIVYFPGGSINYGGEYYVIEYLTQTGAYKNIDAVKEGKFRVLYVNGADEDGKLQVSLYEADQNGDVLGLQRWKDEDLYASGTLFTAVPNVSLLFLSDTDQNANVYVVSHKQGGVLTDTLQCNTQTVLLKKKMAFSPIVTNDLGVSVNKQLEWISVNEEIAEVNQNGKITAKAAGHTAVIGSRENADGSFAAVIIEVYVVTSAKGIRFKPKKDTLAPGDKTKMTVTVMGKDITADLNIRWSVTNSRLAVSQKGTVAAKKVGVSTVKAALEGGLILTCQFTVDFDPIKAKVSQTKSGYAQVKWNRITGASGYRIYRYNYKTKGDPVLIATVKKNETVSYTDKKVKSGIGYAYQVFAYDDSQSETIYSQGSGRVNFKRS